MRAAVLLAAGASRRWGPGNKLLARRRGATMLARTLALARAAPAARLIVVTGWQATRVARVVRRIAPRARIVRARDHREGMGASLRAAGRALWPIEREALLFLADMPRAGGAAALVRAARPGDAAVRPRWRGRPGHPVLLREAPARLRMAAGDAGPLRGLAVRMVAGGRGAVLDRDRPGRR